MRRITNRNREDMIIVDNLIQSFALNMEYGIPIRPYFMGTRDMELKYLADALAQGGENLPEVDCKDFLNMVFKFRGFYEFLK